MIRSWRSSRTEKPDFHKQDLIVCPATRFFDQMSFIGDEVVGCFVIETEKGIVLLDCMNPEDRCIEIIENGFNDLELDIHDLYAIIISHGHGDHFGMAGYFKEKYGAMIYMSKTDYDFARNMPEHFPWKSVTFEVDCYLEDGASLDFGDIKIKAMHTPGHTAGCFSFIIPVTDEGRKHCVALWGGSGIMPDSNKEDYYNSLVRFTELWNSYTRIYDLQSASNNNKKKTRMRGKMIMKYGIYYSYWEKEWEADCFPYVKKVKVLGFDILEVACHNFLSLDEDYFLRLKAEAEKYGIRLTGGYGPDAEHDISPYMKHKIGKFCNVTCNIENTSSLSSCLSHSNHRQTTFFRNISSHHFFILHCF